MGAGAGDWARASEARASDYARVVSVAKAAEGPTSSWRVGGIGFAAGDGVPQKLRHLLFGEKAGWNPMGDFGGGDPDPAPGSGMCVPEFAEGERAAFGGRHELNGAIGPAGA